MRRSKLRSKTYIEIMRIFASFCIIFMHTSYAGYGLFVTADGIYRYIYMVMSIISRSAFPLSFAITGAVLFQKDESYISIWKHRIWRIALCLFFFSLLFSTVQANGAIPKFPEFIHTFFEGGITRQYWYLYAYLALLIMLPFYRRTSRAVAKDFWYMYVLILAAGPCLAFFAKEFLNIQIEPHLRLTCFRAEYLIYPVLGYCMEYRLSGRDRNILHALSIPISALIIFLICRDTCIKLDSGVTSIVELDGYFGTASVGLVPFLYLTFRRIPKFFVWEIQVFGSCTLGIYLMHVPAMACTNIMDIIWAYTGKRMGGVILSCLVLMLLCAALTWLLKKIPILRLLVGG